MTELKEQVSASPSAVTLLEEACRIVGRLDQLDRLLSGEVDAWCRVTESRDGDLDVRVDAALSEARQQANVLRQLLATINELAPREADDGDDDSWAAGLAAVPAPVRNSSN